MSEQYNAKLERYTTLAMNPPKHIPNGYKVIEEKWSSYARHYKYRNNQLEQQIALAERMLEKYKRAKKENDIDMIRERAAYYQVYDILQDNDINMEDWITS